MLSTLLEKHVHKCRLHTFQSRFSGPSRAVGVFPMRKEASPRRPLQHICLPRNFASVAYLGVSGNLPIWASRLTCLFRPLFSSPFFRPFRPPEHLLADVFGIRKFCSTTYLPNSKIEATFLIGLISKIALFGYFTDRPFSPPSGYIWQRNSVLFALVFFALSAQNICVDFYPQGHPL